MNFKSLGNQPAGSFHLARQGSIYSLTFDELQNSMGSINGKDFGSMNMDELLKSIWNAEEVVQTGGNNNAVSNGGGGIIQRQGSLTLPRTLSQKTVDEVWKDISKEFNGFGEPTLPQRQQTLGEMTLEEFLVKAGVVREDPELVVNKPNDTGLFQNNPVFSLSPVGLGLQGACRNGIHAPGNVNNGNHIGFQPNNNPPLNVNGVRSTQSQQQSQSQSQRKSQQLLPMNISSKPLGMGVSDMGLGVPAGGVTVAAVGSPMGKNNGDTPSPYEFSGIVRGRKSGAVEKVVERRHRRMIKNRESAARSRDRKQAYTMELEAEVAKLKEQNQELKRNAEMMEMEQYQVLGMMSTQPGAKRRCLRRTQSGQW